MTTYVWSDAIDHWVDKKTNEPMYVPDRGPEPSIPMVVSDTPEYLSPVTGRPVDGRRARREDLARSGCVPFEPLSNRPRGVGNPKMAAKYGVKLDEAAFHRPKPKRINPITP